MLTTLQFSQLAAAAWSGPAATTITGIEHYVAAAAEHTTTTYTASYHLGGACYMGRAECPFEAVAIAVQRYAASIEAQATRQLASARAACRFAHRALVAAGHRLVGRSPRAAGFAGRARLHRCARLARA